MIRDLLVVVTSLRYQFLDALFLSISCLSSYVSRQCFHNQLMCLKLQTDTSISPPSPSHPTHTKLENGVITWKVIFLYHTIFWFVHQSYLVGKISHKLRFFFYLFRNVARGLLDREFYHGKAKDIIFKYIPISVRINKILLVIIFICSLLKWLLRHPTNISKTFFIYTIEIDNIIGYYFWVT